MKPDSMDLRDHFSDAQGSRYAGTHLLVDMWGATGLTDRDGIEATLREAALAARATILGGTFHVFSPQGGVTGVLLLAESHISIHTWPELGFAAIDVFMCAGCEPMNAMRGLKSFFRPERTSIKTLRRGEESRGAHPD